MANQDDTVMEGDAEHLRREIRRIDEGQIHIIGRLNAQDETLKKLVESQTEQTRMLRPISDYFAFGRVTKTIFVGLAGLAAFIAGVVTTWKAFLK